MLPRDINELCAKIKTAGFHITIETAGTIYRELACDLMSLSPKLANSDPPASRAGEWTKNIRPVGTAPISSANSWQTTIAS